jgi:hypothetical protein
VLQLARLDEVSALRRSSIERAVYALHLVTRKGQPRRGSIATRTTPHDVHLFKRSAARPPSQFRARRRARGHPAESCSTTMLLNQTIELGGKRPARVGKRRTGPRRHLKGAAVTQFSRRIAPYVAAEIDAAASFAHLERAHVLGQASTTHHVRVHMQMFAWAMRHRIWKEARGQALRIVGAAAKTALGWVPTGNTGGANISPFKALPIPPDLAQTIERAKRA